jgi:ribonuclease T2
MQITPSSSQAYSATAIQNAIIAGTTYTPDLVCTDGALSSVQFYLNAQGPLQNGVFVQGVCVLSFCLFRGSGPKSERRPTRTSSCPAQVTWPPKTVGAGAQRDEL